MSHTGRPIRLMYLVSVVTVHNWDYSWFVNVDLWLCSQVLPEYIGRNRWNCPWVCPSRERASVNRTRSFWPFSAILGHFGSISVRFGPFWAYVLSFWAHFEPSWAYFGSFWTHFGPYWACFGQIWAIVGLFWSVLRPLGSILGLFWGNSSQILACFGQIWAVFGIFWSVLRDFRAYSGPVWAYFGQFLGVMGLFWAYFSQILGRFGPL